MAAEPKSASTLRDLLAHKLSDDGRQTLYDCIRRQLSVRNARAAFRELRDLIDGQVPSLTLNRKSVSPSDLAWLCEGDRWLQRWPRVTSVWVGPGSVDRLRLLFDGVTLRITGLSVYSSTKSRTEAPGSHLFVLLSSLPAQQNVLLKICVPDRAMGASDFAALTQLTEVQLPTAGLTHDLTSEVVGRLTRAQLCVTPETWDVARVHALLSSMTSIQELELSFEGGGALYARELPGLIDALPVRAVVFKVGGFARRDAGAEPEFMVTARLVDGCLASFTLEADGPDDFTHLQLSTFLAQALLPCRALGPRLPLLSLDVRVTTGISAQLPDPDPAASLLARCDVVQLGVIQMEDGASSDEVMALAARCGLPESMSVPFNALDPEGSESYLELRGRGRGGGSGSGNQQRSPPLALDGVVKLAVGRMAAAACKIGFQDGALLLRGPGVRMLLAAPAALEAWLKQAAREAAQRLSFRALPSAGAVVVNCDSAKGARAVAQAAQRMAGGAREGEGGAGAQPALQVLFTELHFADAVMQVLQDLWDGKEPGAPAPAAPGNREEELQRLSWLLGLVEGLRARPPRVDLQG